MALEEIGIQLKGIGSILSEGNLSVPVYQRSYSWTDKQVTELFQDINTALKDNEKEYFLGAIVIARESTDRPEVVDGQQRLATTAILLAAIRDYFYKTGDKERATDIENKFLFSKKFRTQEPAPKFSLNEVDRDFYLKTILSATKDKKMQPSTSSHKRILKASNLAAEWVDNLTKMTTKPTDQLADWYEFIEKKAKVIAVTVPDHSNAFTIFETLNDRGLDLAISDLLKNYLFHKSEDRFKEVQQRWISMTGTIEAAADESLIVPFIRQFWSSKNGLTREKDLYSKIKSSITSKQKAIDISTELLASSKIYAAIINIDNELWQKYGSTARGHMATLNLLNMSQIRPLILAMLQKFSVKEVKRGLRLLSNLAIRFTITGALGGGSLESHYSEVAKEISEGAIKSAEDLLKRMVKIAPNDKEFRSAFILASVSKNYLARYYLTVLEKQANGEEDPEYVPNLNEEEVNLEHILPENPSSDWKIKKEVAEEYYKKIGNLTLIKCKINSISGNEVFSEKVKIYAKSKFKITSEIAGYKKWTSGEIDERQTKLAVLALKAWPLNLK